MSWSRKQINHVLGNKPLALKGIAKAIERLGSLSCKHCRQEVYEKLKHIEEELIRHAKDLDALRKNWHG